MMMPTAAFTPVSATLPARRTAPVTGSLEWRRGAEPLAAGRDRVDDARGFCDVRDADAVERRLVPPPDLLAEVRFARCAAPAARVELDRLLLR